MRNKIKIQFPNIMKIFKTAALAFIAICLMAATPFTTDTEDVRNDHHKDIVSLAMDTDQLSTLVTAVKEAGLVETLKSDGPFTVFAPTNEAFAALPDGTLESLLKEENRDQLVKILTYHVVPGKVMSSDLQDGMMAETVQGSSVTINLDNGVQVDNANVVNADINASNGVVHIIDSVILPEENETASTY